MWQPRWLKLSRIPMSKRKINNFESYYINRVFGKNRRNVNWQNWKNAATQEFLERLCIYFKRKKCCSIPHSKFDRLFPCNHGGPFCIINQRGSRIWAEKLAHTFLFIDNGSGLMFDNPNRLYMDFDTTYYTLGLNVKTICISIDKKTK